MVLALVLGDTGLDSNVPKNRLLVEELTTKFLGHNVHVADPSSVTITPGMRPIAPFLISNISPNQ